MSRRSNVRPATVLGFGLGGVLVGHALTYLVLVPDAHARAAELSATGHAYLGGANAFGLVAVIAALSILFFRGLAGADGGASRVYERLAAFQLTAFAAMEILERLGSGVGARHLVPTLAVGLPVQILVAAFVALLVRLVARAAAAVADRGSTRSARVVLRGDHADRRARDRAGARPRRRSAARPRSSDPVRSLTSSPPWSGTRTTEGVHRCDEP